MNEEITEYALDVAKRAQITGEPVFVLRAGDVLAPYVITAWIEQAKRWHVRKEKREAAVAHLQVVQAWQRDHGAKIPD